MVKRRHVSPYQHVRDTIRKGVADQVGGLLWGSDQVAQSAAEHARSNLDG
jgi:hypothetical protein